MLSGNTKLGQLRAELAEAISAQTEGEGDFPGRVPGLHLYRRHFPAISTCQVYEPALAIVAQGAKVLEIGSETLPFSEANWLITPLHTPAMSRITRASPRRPYLACAVLLDLTAAREILSECEVATDGSSPSEFAVTTGPLYEELTEVMLRLVRLNQAPKDIAVLSRLLHRELLYRLLTSPHGGAMRQILTTGSQSQRVAKAVNWIQRHFREPLQLEILAQQVNMGVSTLHHHFRALTGSSPLQFQKQLRLIEARRLMLMDGLDAASAAFNTGYESATQFNREYRRQFGQPPRKNVLTLRGAVALATAG